MHSSLPLSLCSFNQASCEETQGVRCSPLDINGKTLGGHGLFVAINNIHHVTGLWLLLLGSQTSAHKISGMVALNFPEVLTCSKERF